MWFGCASLDFPVSLTFNIVFILLVVIDMVHPDMFTKAIVSVDDKPTKVNHDVKLDEKNDDVKSDEVNVNVKPGTL